MKKGNIIRLNIIYFIFNPIPIHIHNMRKILFKFAFLSIFIHSYFKSTAIAMTDFIFIFYLYYVHVLFNNCVDVQARTYIFMDRNTRTSDGVFFCFEQERDLQQCGAIFEHNMKL